MNPSSCALGIAPSTLSAWRSHLLAPDAMHQIDNHIADCSACKTTLARFDRIAQAVRTPPTMPKGEEIWHKMQQRMNQPPPPSDPQRQRLVVAGGLSAVALVAVIAVVVFMLANSNTGSSKGPALSTSTATNSTTVATITGTGTPNGTGMPAGTGTPSTGSSSGTGTPVANRPYLYIQSGGGRVFALNPTNKQIVWQQNNNHGGGYSVPIVTGGVVYAPFYGPSAGQPAVFAFDAQTGKQLWRTGTAATYTLIGTDNSVLFAHTVNTIAAFRMSDGKALWTYHFTNTEGNLSFTVGNGLVAYFDLDGAGNTPQIVAVDESTATDKWSVAIGTDNTFGDLVMGSGVLYSYENGNNVRTLSLTDGHQLWKVQPSPGTQPGVIAYTAGILFASTNDDYLVALNPQTGATLWSVKTSNHDPGVPAVANGVAYLGATDSHFYAIDVATGKLRWKLSAGLTYGNPSVVSDGWVFVYIGNGVILAYDANTGANVWTDFADFGTLVGAS
jgi:outer membrane protein assembly factor BamB